MCGRIARERDDDYRLFGVDELVDLRPDIVLPFSWNIGPGQMDGFIRDTGDGRAIVASRWGLVPRWAKERTASNKLFNARSETVLEKPSFRPLVSSHRCVIPASGFYEWHAQGKGKAKQPLYIHRTDGQPLGLAGLWTTWTDPENDEVLTSHTVLTCEPNDFMAPIHNRMPVILEGDALDEWLDADERTAVDVVAVLRPCANDLLTAYPVSTLVNNVRHDGPELIAPVKA
jgi:putative SOS response-associated peptidase YedK